MATYKPAKLHPSVLAALERRIGTHHAKQWTGLIGFDTRAFQAVAPDGSRRQWDDTEVIQATEWRVEGNLIHVTFPGGTTLVTWKPYWLD